MNEIIEEDEDRNGTLVRIRRSGVEDLDRINSLAKSLPITSMQYEWNGPDIDEFLRSYDGVPLDELFVVEEVDPANPEQATVGGFAHLEMMAIHSINEQRFGLLHAVVVDTDHRGLHRSSWLVSALTVYAENELNTPIAALVPPDSPLIGMLTDCLFTSTLSIPHCYGPRQDRLYFSNGLGRPPILVPPESSEAISWMLRQDRYQLCGVQLTSLGKRLVFRDLHPDEDED